MAVVRNIRPLLALSVWEGGLDLPDPTTSAAQSHTNSQMIVETLTRALATNSMGFDVMEFVQQSRETQEVCQIEHIKAH